MVLHGGIISLATMLFFWALVFSTKLIANQVLASQGCEAGKYFLLSLRFGQNNKITISSPLLHAALLKRLMWVEAFVSVDGVCVCGGGRRGKGHKG